MSVGLEAVEEAVSADPERLVRLPALVRGRLLLAATRRSERASPEDSYTLRRPVLDPARLEPTGDVQTLVLPAVDAASLEVDAAAVDTLLRLPFSEVLAYVGALRAALADRPELVQAVSRASAATSPAGRHAGEVHAELLRELLNPEGLAVGVDRDLGSPDVPGRRYLDEWVPAAAKARRGVAAEIGRALFGADGPPLPPPHLRALPTRQLHIAAGNSPVIPLISVLRSFATKSPAVVKSSSESFLAATLLAIAMHAVDPDHPLTRHTSLVCWPGGDRRIEDALLSASRFDRLVAWGSEETLASLRARSAGIRTIVFGPRFGVSLIGRAALDDDPAGIASRASADALVDDQQACMASLVQYVEGSPADALDYCETLRAALARWDAAVAAAPTRRTTGRLRLLRRGRLARDRWFTNVRNGTVTSAVVCASRAFDVSEHPTGRCIVVRPVDDLADAVELLDARISTVGVAPEERRTELRDGIAARGVTSIVPLGEAERAFAGMPHDGMRVLSELVNWATS